MKEKNYHILKEALKKLPVYLAPTHIWQKIQEGLEENRLKDLPLYKAPAEAWPHIVAELQKKRAPHTYWLIAVGIAAMVFLAAILPGEEDKFVDTPPISLKKELKEAPILKPATEATYETQFVALEKDLASCLLGLSGEEAKDARPKLAQYYAAAAKQDHFLILQKKDSQPSHWADSLIMIEEKRQELIDDLFRSYCPQFLDGQKEP